MDKRKVLLTAAIAGFFAAGAVVNHTAIADDTAGGQQQGEKASCKGGSCKGNEAGAQDAGAKKKSKGKAKAKKKKAAPADSSAQPSGG